MQEISLSGEAFSIEFFQRPDGLTLAKIVGPLPAQGVGNAGVVVEATGRDQAEAKSAAMKRLPQRLAAGAAAHKKREGG